MNRRNFLKNVTAALSALPMASAFVGVKVTGEPTPKPPKLELSDWWVQAVDYYDVHGERILLHTLDENERFVRLLLPKFDPCKICCLNIGNGGSIFIQMRVPLGCDCNEVVIHK